MSRLQRKFYALIHGATLVIALAAIGCGGSSGGGTTPLDENPGDTNPGDTNPGDDTPSGPSAALQAAGDCLGVGMQDAFEMLLGVLDLAAAVDDPGSQPAGVNYDPSNGEFTISLDLDGDGTPDAAVNGMVTSSDDISDGFATGESFTMQWSFGGVLNGSGGFTVTRDSASEYTVTGSGSVQDSAEACSVAMTDVDVSLDSAQDLPATVTDGTITFTVDALGGTITFTGTVTADVEGDLGSDAVSFVLDLVMFEPDFS